MRWRGKWDAKEVVKAKTQAEGPDTLQYLLKCFASPISQVSGLNQV